MGLTKLHQPGERRRVAIKEETTFGTVVKPTAAAPGAIRFEEFSIGREGPARELHKFTNLGSRGYSARITGMRSGVWSGKKHLIPSGTAGTPPEDHVLWKRFFGTYTNTPGTSDAYTFALAQGSLGSLSMFDSGATAQKSALGAFLDEFSIEQDGPNPPMVSFSGRAKDTGSSGKGVVSSVASDVVTLTTANGGGKNFQAGAIVAFYNPTTGAVVDNNSGNGYLIESVSGNDINLDGNPSTSAADLVLPFLPAPSFVGSALGGQIGSVVVTPASESGITLAGITKISVSGKNNIRVFDDVAFSSTFPDYVEGMAELSAEITFKLREDLWQFFARQQATPEKAYGIVVVWGSTAGSICTVTLGQAELDGLPSEWPSEGEAEVTLKAFALASTVNLTDLGSVVFT